MHRRMKMKSKLTYWHFICLLIRTADTSTEPAFAFVAYGDRITARREARKHWLSWNSGGNVAVQTPSDADCQVFDDVSQKNKISRFPKQSDISRQGLVITQRPKGKTIEREKMAVVCFMNIM